MTESSKLEAAPLSGQGLRTSAATLAGSSSFSKKQYSSITSKKLLIFADLLDYLVPPWDSGSISISWLNMSIISRSLKLADALFFGSLLLMFTSIKDFMNDWIDAFCALFFMVYLSMRANMHFFRIFSVMMSWHKDRSLSNTGKMSS